MKLGRERANRSKGGSSSTSPLKTRLQKRKAAGSSPALPEPEESVEELPAPLSPSPWKKAHFAPASSLDKSSRSKSLFGNITASSSDAALRRDVRELKDAVQELSHTAFSPLDTLGQHELLFASLPDAVRHLISRVNEISDRLNVLESRQKAILERVSRPEIPMRPRPFASDASKQLSDLSSRGPEKPAATDLSAAEESEEEVEYLGSPVPAGDRSENPSTPAPATE
ncbi:hypothetical protein VTO42DRAFT_5082 [Malbranchea cinnamomea]